MFLHSLTVPTLKIGLSRLPLNSALNNVLKLAPHTTRDTVVAMVATRVIGPVDERSGSE